MRGDPGKLVECVPNFSEGRDASKVQGIVDAITSAGVLLLARESDADHDRSVVTFAGDPDGVLEGAFRGIAAAVKAIDLNAHRGVHPRIGAADVVPFVPLRNVTMEECAALAHRLGERVWRELGLPVYFYEAAAKQAARKRLEVIRKGQFEALREEVRTNPARRPDIGESELHPTAGAVAIGARKILIAYNINLNTTDVAVAKDIARSIRESSGGFPCVKAIGLTLATRNQAQVSINLTDYEQTPVHVVFEAVMREAADRGVTVAGSEIIGLWPRDILEITAKHFLQFENYRRGNLLEDRLEAAYPRRNLF